MNTCLVADILLDTVKVTVGRYTKIPVLCIYRNTQYTYKILTDCSSCQHSCGWGKWRTYLVLMEYFPEKINLGWDLANKKTFIMQICWGKAYTGPWNRNSMVFCRNRWTGSIVEWTLTASDEATIGKWGSHHTEHKAPTCLNSVLRAMRAHRKLVSRERFKYVFKKFFLK